MFIDYKQTLAKAVNFKSISTDSKYKTEIIKMVTWLSQIFSKSGFDTELLESEKNNPVLFANYVTDINAETILVYGHYDVQPASLKEGWDMEPFQLVEKNSRLYGRGVVDNKGQFLIHAQTIFELIKTNKLKYNVKFYIEGNEETGGSQKETIEKYKEKLAADYVIISDGEIPYKPSIESSLRGGFNLTLTYITAKTNVHSGIFGGAIPNSSHELSKLISKFYNKENLVIIPNFYDNVDTISSKQRRNNKHLLENKKKIYEITGVKTLLTEKDTDFYTQTGLRPTLQVTGFKSGYIDEGYANIIPHTAEARINFRIVASQKPNDVLKIFEKFVKSNTPKHVKFKIKTSGLHDPIKINIDTKKVRETQKLLEQAYGIKPLVKPVGGAIPIVSDFKNVLNIDSILISMGNEDCNMHGANENFDINLLKKGLKFSKLFFSK